MNYEEFMEKPAEQEIEVQKAVVESLAADKAEQDIIIENLRKEKDALLSRIADTKVQLEQMRCQLEKVGDLLARNSETPFANKLALLDRPMELDDRFEGETRDHVLEAIREERDRCEAEGRLRRAQILEGVLTANDPCGILAKKRSELKKLFEDNQNVINGQVINELNEQGIAYKVGENYLLTSEIIKRVY